MRFRSVLRLKAGNSVSSTSARSPPKRLWWCLRARATLFAIGATIIAAVIADRAWIRGNGIVSGELTAVAPIVQARIQRVLVNCLDRVVQGQHLAEFENEATVENAAQQLKQLELQLTQARAEIDIAEAQAQVALKLVDAQVALFDQLKAVLKAQDELIKKQYVAQLIWERTKADVTRAEAEVRAAEFVSETKKADRKKAELAATVLQQRIDSFKNSPELTGHFVLTAPKDGIVTECAARPGEVIAAKTPIFQIFNPDDSYAVVFFDPNDVAKLAFGQRFTLSIGGIEGPVTARVTGFYPELSALPSSLTRYFWQQEKWSQYAPVRLDFDRLSAAQKNRVFAWAQLAASRWQGWGLLDPPSWVQLAWQWVRGDPDKEKRAAAKTLTKTIPTKTNEAMQSAGRSASATFAPTAVRRDALAGPASAHAAPQSEGRLIPEEPLSMASTGGSASDTAAKPGVSTQGVIPTAEARAVATPSGERALNAAIVAATPTPEVGATPPSSLDSSHTAIPTLLARGDALLRTGDVTSARLFYERAVDAGEAQAAARLGQTFDPVLLNPARLRGDPGKALFWYRRARDLGATEVISRLKSLEAKTKEELP